MADLLPLNYTKEAKHRIIVGLGWDPAEKKFIGTVKAIASGKKTHHDLDLSCYNYGQDNNYLDHVSAKAENFVDISGNIYHSGDNVEGIGDGDDEEISIELLDIPKRINHILFIATIRTGQSFNEIDTPEIRIKDAYTNRTLHSHQMDKDSNNKTNGFVYARLSKINEEWKYKVIKDYQDLNKIEDLPEFLKSYL